jgi:pentose-5-phosphate-3-epimerase
MISDPDLFLDAFVEAGFNSFLVHWEGNNNLHRTVHRVKGLGKRVGVGASACANKIAGVRAALIHDHFSARHGVEDDQPTQEAVVV